jgi:FkbM family methyltransferase
MKTLILKLTYYIFSRILISCDIFFRKICNINYFLPWIHDYIESKQYFSQRIDKKKINFFCPSRQTLRRVENLFKKEPETLNWINNFKPYNSNKIIFWDIGANVGLFSIYAAAKFQNIKIFSFEPSTSNTRTLSRNISINKFNEKINIFPLALSELENNFASFDEKIFSEGSSNSTFNNNNEFNIQNTKMNQIENRYNIFGTSIDYLILNNIIQIPNYIKIDVDGIEYLILKGAKNLLKNDSLLELSIEMNPSSLKEYNLIYEYMKENEFELAVSTNKNLLANNEYKLKLNETVNVVFKRKSKF